MLYLSNLSPRKCNIYSAVLLWHYLTQVASLTVIRICDFRKEPLDCKSDCSTSPEGKKNLRMAKSFKAMEHHRMDAFLKCLLSHLIVQFLILKVIFMVIRARQASRKKYPISNTD